MNGWISKNYCDVIANGNIVRVWSRENGMKADAIREEIEVVSKQENLNKWEKYTLITSLILALDKVDNTVRYSTSIPKRILHKIQKTNEIRIAIKYQWPNSENILFGDCLNINYPEIDLAYLDPPYTSAIYSTYYHIWDSVVRWDKPETFLKTNRRKDRVFASSDSDKTMKSLWNSNKTVGMAFEELIRKTSNKKYLIVV